MQTDNGITVLITTSGSGSRMGELTRYTNKTLIRVGQKPAISYIIESYPKTTHFVITLGHFGIQVKEFLELVYPKRFISFVEIDRYEGKGSSLGYSMLKASKYLQKPFIYHASDTIVLSKIPKPTLNWVAGVKGEGSSNYASFNLLNNKIQTILDKGIPDPDYLHIGLVGIFDYLHYWKILNRLYKLNTFKEGLADFQVINEMINHGLNFKVYEYKTWYDTGNTESLLNTRKLLANGFYNLDKTKESIFLFDNRLVVKFNSDPQKIKEQKQRAENLKGLTPIIKASVNNFLVYKYVNGRLFSDIANPENFVHFLKWSQIHLWKKVLEVSDKQFKNICYNFYYKKTKDRIREFLSSRGILDLETNINDKAIPPFSEILKEIDFDWLCTTDQRTFHGDYILDNIIKTRTGYCLLDWRNNFGGLLIAGDMYYDLAKLNHSLIINHKVVSDNLFTFRQSGRQIACDILRKDSLIQCQQILFEFLEYNKLDSGKVAILTALVWVNSAPLHHKPYDKFLFYFGKYHLWKTLKK